MSLFLVGVIAGAGLLRALYIPNHIKIFKRGYSIGLTQGKVVFDEIMEHPDKLTARLYVDASVNKDNVV